MPVPLSVYTTRIIFSLFFLMTFCSERSSAQVETAEISGTVKDVTGAVLPAATINARCQPTGLTRSTETDNFGLYRLTHLPPCEYEFTIKAANFAVQKITLEVNVGASYTINASLRPATATSVEVVAESPVKVETESQEISTVVNGKEITELPTLTRNPYDLVQTSGNISPADPSAHSGPSFGPRGVGVSINGQRSTSTNIQLDGGDNTDQFYASVGLTVPLDAVREFRIVSSSFQAQYGRAGGGIINVATKQGTNELHGSVYEFNRASALASLEFNSIHTTFIRNQFGYSVGGPIIKDKLFFFQSTEWTRVRSAVSVGALVPTPDFIADSAPATQAFFSAYGKLLVPITQVFTKANILASGIVPNAGGPFDLLAGGTPIFGVIHRPLPKDAGAGIPQNSFNPELRVDYDLSNRTMLFARYINQTVDNLPGTAAPSPYVGYDLAESDFNNSGLVSVTHVFSPRLASESKLAFNRTNRNTPIGKVLSSPLLAFGFGDLFGFGTPLLPGYNGNIGGGPSNLLEFLEDVTYSRGKHQFRLGGQFTYTRDNLLFDTSEAYGVLGISGSYGDGLDEFLEGQTDEYVAIISAQDKLPCTLDSMGNVVTTPSCVVQPPLGPSAISTSNRYRDFAWYGQDSWKLTPRFTANLGLRWEYYGVQHSKQASASSNFYPGRGTNFFEQVRNGQIFTAPTSPVGSLYRPDYNNFAPRIGFAWDPIGAGTTALRGGYGIGFERNFNNVNANVFVNPPNADQVLLLTGVNAGVIPISTSNAGPLAAQGNSLPLPPAGIIALNPNIRTAYAQSWSLSLEHALRKDTLASLQYSASKGTKLYADTDINRAGSGAEYLHDAPTPGLPFPRLNQQYTFINYRNNGGFSTYHAMIASLRSENLFNAGLGFQANYTWSHAIDDMSSTFTEGPNVSPNNLGFLDPFNPAVDKGNADFDIRHRFVFSGVWELPWLKERSRSLLARSMLGGWSLAPIFEAHSGTPFSVYDCSNFAEECPRYIPTGAVATSVHDPEPVNIPGAVGLYNILTLPPAQPYGDPILGIGDFGDCTHGFPCPFPAAMTHRNAFRGRGGWKLDLGTYKTVALSEPFNLQLRAEAFNVFNHRLLMLANGPPDASTAAGGPLTIRGQRGGHRNMQLALKLTF
jgi:hypothetical protein